MTDIHSCSYYCNRPECIKAQRDELRDRLAQPEQEPVAWMVLGDGEYGEYAPGMHFDTVGYKEYWERRGYELQPLYTAPPQRQWVEASGKEIRKLIPKADVWKYEVGHDEALKLIRSALALAKEKNNV